MMGFWAWYLIIVNAIGFVLFLINTWLYSHTEEGQVDKWLTITSLLGGSAGILLAILIFDRKAVKGNMMSRVFIACIFVIQLVVFLFIKGGHVDKLIYNVSSFFNHYKWLFIYLLIINITTFIAFTVDKFNAIEGRTRIRIVTLLGLAFFGGSVGGIGAMYLFRHKTSKDYFTVGIPLIMIMQVVVLGYIFLT